GGRDGMREAVARGRARDGGPRLLGRNDPILRRTGVLLVGSIARRTHNRLASTHPARTANLLHPARLTDPRITVTVTRSMSSLELFVRCPSHIIIDVSAL